MPLLGDFGFGIVGKQEKNDCVALDSGDKYKLKLWNFKTRLRCDAEVKIDGKVVGIFRIDKMKSIIVERPTNDYGHFTFYTAGTIEAKMAMLDAVDQNNLGLIEVTFYPEKKPIQQESYILEDRDELESLRRQINSNGYLESRRSDYIAGGTGLSGYSNVDYEKIQLLNHDYDSIVTIHLRLISKKIKPHPLPQKLTSIENELGMDLSAWIADQQAKLAEEKALLKASMAKKSLEKEYLINLVVEQNQILAEYRRKIASLEIERIEEESIDYWEID